MYKREKFLAELNDNRIVRPFEWGREFAAAQFVANQNGDSPQSFFKNYAANAVEHSNKFFEISDSEYEFSNNILTWKSQTETDSPENNIARARFFPVEKPQNRKRAVLILPHWNAPAESYFALCKVFNRVGIAALRLTLPYHEERMPREHERADWLVCPNIGRTLQSIRQAVLDTRTAISWLEDKGFEQIGIVGTSIGSCVAFLAMVHEPRIDAAVFNHVSGYVGDVCWRGISTYHVKESLEKAVTLEELREFWSPVSPMSYLEKLKNLPARPIRFIYALYDLTFPVDLSLDMLTQFRRYGIKYEETALPCGHYTLGESPWVYIDGWKIVNFLRTKL